MKKPLSVLAIGNVRLGARRARAARWPAPLSVSELRCLLGRARRQAAIGPLSPDGARGIALAFVGGHHGHAQWAGPLVEALGLCAHFFVPLESIGLPGRMTLFQLEELGRCRGAKIELDLSLTRPRTTRSLATQIRQRAATLRSRTGHRPRYAWVRGEEWDGRLSLLLQQHRFQGAVSADIARHEVAERTPLLAARYPSWRHRWGWGRF